MRSRLLINIAIVLVGVFVGALIGGIGTATQFPSSSRSTPSPQGSLPTRSSMTEDDPRLSLATPTTGTRMLTPTLTQSAQAASTQTIPERTPTPTLRPIPAVEGAPITAPTPAAPQTYVIQEGDILYRIAQRFGVSLEDLLRANPGIRPEALQVGQTILIPPPSTPTAGPAAPG